MVTNGHRPVEVYDTDRYQRPLGHHWRPMVVSADGRSPNARVDSASCWREAASTIEQLKLLLLNLCEKQKWKPSFLNF